MNEQSLATIHGKNLNSFTLLYFKLCQEVRGEFVTSLNSSKESHMFIYIWLQTKKNVKKPKLGSNCWVRECIFVTLKCPFSVCSYPFPGLYSPHCLMCCQRIQRPGKWGSRSLRHGVIAGIVIKVLHRKPGTFLQAEVRNFMQKRTVVEKCRMMV